MDKVSRILAAGVQRPSSGKSPVEEAGTMYDKLDRVSRILAPIRQGDVDPLTLEIDEVLGPTSAKILGNTTALFGTNNYLGMNFEPECMNAAVEAIQKFGTGTTASRVAAGTHSGHISIEKEIAAFFGRREAILFSTGFLANLGTITGLTGEGDYIVLDEDCHASIYDGCTQSTATVVSFKHNNPEDLAAKIEGLGVPGGRILIVVEGLYSVAGDIAPLREFVEVKKKAGAVLLVDEAHSFGIFGESGRGMAEELGVEDDVDIIVGTFSKSVGVVGGFAVCDRDKFEDLRFLARSYLFTASLPPAVIAAARAAFVRIGNGTDLRLRLVDNISALYNGLLDMGIEPMAPRSPVIAVRVPRMSEGYKIWRTLLENGILTNYMVPPATPGPYSVIRCSVSSAHTPNQVSLALEAFRSVADRLVRN